jgi:TonB family protein
MLSQKGELVCVKADPLIMLLGKAISKHFQYPEMAGKLGIAGRALVKITLMPEGNIVNVTMVSSSNSHDLDAAALYAINKAPLIPEAGDYIKKPKTMVIGFIFRIGPPG